jgi:serine/threonine protein phosphatase 1
MKRTFAIGDIHGCSDLLIELLDNIGPFAPGDTVMFIGDYIDRGPDSKGVLDIILALRQKHDRVITLMGNHEFMLLAALNGHNREEFLEMGGDATLRSYGLDPSSLDGLASVLPESHRGFLDDLLPYWEDEKFIYVHAGLKPGVHLTQQSPDWLYWSRDEFINSSHNFGKMVIYGHTPYGKPRIDANKIGIDTGAVYGNALTCLVLPETRFVTIEAGKTGR